jgi:agmatine deiminase
MFSLLSTACATASKRGFWKHFRTIEFPGKAKPASHPENFAASQLCLVDKFNSAKTEIFERIDSNAMTQRTPDSQSRVFPATFRVPGISALNCFRNTIFNLNRTAHCAVDKRAKRLIFRASFMAQEQITTDKTPAALGFSMPAEWEKHEATWLGWPHNETDWPDKIDTIRWVYGEMVRKISQGELVRILVRGKAEQKFAANYLKRACCDLKKVEFVVHPTNRGWTRDSGPIFVRRGKARKSETAIVHFHFNAWAKYKDWEKDTRVPETAARLLKKPLFNAQFNGKNFIVEGGGIEVNGRGTLLTTEECYQHPKIQVRNPGMTKADYNGTFQKYLGVTNVLWLRNGPVGDDTHGHIDDIARFVNSKTIVLIRETNKRDINYKPLSENWERISDFRLEDGSKPEIVPLPMPAPLHYGNWRLPASYANFYISNACVIVPTFNDPNDRVALGILGDLFKDRTVVGIHAVDLVLGFGSLHCLTQQQPA